MKFLSLALLPLLLGTGWAQAPAPQVEVAAGPFIRGTDHRRATDEKPARSIYLDAFYLDRYEVTRRQFAAFVEATGYVTAAEAADAPERADGISWRQPEGAGMAGAAGPDEPVVYVNWHDAQAYCAWRGQRLPSEAEWEKAARGTDRRMWPWGADYSAGRANLWGAEDGYAGIAPVGALATGASPYGAEDMAGNVWEWCADWYGAAYYAQGPDENPPGPAQGRLKILRGGSWSNLVGTARTVNRFKLLPQERSPHIGFRCARSP